MLSFFSQAVFFQSVFTQTEYIHWQITTAPLVSQCIICYSDLMSLCDTLPVDGSANNVICWGGHFWEIAGLHEHGIVSQVQLEQKNSLNSLKLYPNASWSKGSRNFERKAWFWIGARLTLTTDEKRRILILCVQQSPQAPAEPQVLRCQLTIERASFNSIRSCEEIPSMHTYPSDFPEMTASTQSVICWTAQMVGWNKVTLNQTNKWCFDELMLLWYFANVCTSLRSKRIGKISPG